MVDLNLNSLSIDASGRVVFSGLGTGINIQGAVDGLVKAKRLPAVTLETRITENAAKVTALKALRGSLNALKDAISSMRGAVSFGNASNVFATKQTFASTSRTDGLSPSSAGNLIGISVQNSAPLGSQTIDVRRLATAHKIASSTFASSTAALGIAGTFSIQGSTGITGITVAASDTLTDIRDRINNANTGSSPTEVTASIVRISSTSHVLVLSNDNPGTDLDITDVGTALSGLGLSTDNGATFSNVTQRAETARVTSNGLTNQKHFESSRVNDQTAQLSGFLGSATFPGAFTINGTGSAAINYTGTTTLSGLATSINLQTATTGVTASVVQDGTGFRLDLDSASNFTLTDTNGLLADLDVNNLQVIERTSNIISDLITGMTISLFGAEPGTTIEVDVERDLTSVKSDVEAVVEAYNQVRRLINENSLRNNDGTKSEDAGELFGMPIISELRASLSAIIGSRVSGVINDYAGLAAVGIGFVDNDAIEDVLDKDTLEIDTTTLDEALLNNPEDVRRLFAFDFTGSDNDVVLLGFTGKTTYAASGYTLNIGTFGTLHKDSIAVTDQTALLNTASSFNATTLGSFTVNGALVTYDVTTDTLDSLVAKINDATTTAGNGVVATLIAASATTIKLSLNSTQGEVTLAGDTGNLVAALNVTANTEKLDFANIGGAAAGTDDGTATVSGRTITVTNANGAEGLSLFYSGSGSASAIELDFTIGIGARLDALLNKFVDTLNGSIETEIDTLVAQSETAQTRIDELDERLVILRASLTARFIAMETAVTSMRQLLDSLQGQFAALTNRGQ